jgi:hypothetical protein
VSPSSAAPSTATSSTSTSTTHHKSSGFISRLERTLEFWR